MVTDTIYINKCECGWRFLSYSEYEKKCPQCREYDPELLRTCVCCGAELFKNERKYCKHCAPEVKKIYNRVFMQNKRTFKDKIQSEQLCNYDCANCPYAECIIPIDDDDYYSQGELF